LQTRFLFKNQTISDKYRALHTEKGKKRRAKTVARRVLPYAKAGQEATVANGSMLGHQDNRLLAALPREMLDLMGHDLKQIPLEQGQAIYEPGARIDKIYFPQSGMISLLVVAKDGGAVETATIGREGALGLHAALGQRLSFTRATTQVAGQFSIIRASALGHLVQDHAPMRDMITRYTEVLWTEAQQLAACNAAHEASARLCRWLLQTSDRIGSQTVPLTQELIAQMLGVRRTTVTLIAQSLQAQGVIKYMRGRISILDREKLEHCACECYAVMQQEKLPLKIGVKL
jgi:CRP-like cAMP-binding protein